MALEWQTQVVVPPFRKGDRRVCSNYRVITLHRVHILVKLWIQDEHCSFCPGYGTLDQLYTYVRVLEEAWEFLELINMSFVDHEKAYDRVS